MKPKYFSSAVLAVLFCTSFPGIAYSAGYSVRGLSARAMTSGSAV